MTGFLNAEQEKSSETIRQLSSQISSLSGTVAQLLSVQASQHQQSLQRHQSSPVLVTEAKMSPVSVHSTFTPSRPMLNERSISLDVCRPFDFPGLG